jgi:hypothetical protein
MAENGGFEPPIELSPYNGLANRRLQPLGQLSVLCCGEHEGVMPGFGNYSKTIVPRVSGSAEGPVGESAMRG